MSKGWQQPLAPTNLQLRTMSEEHDRPPDSVLAMDSLPLAAGGILRFVPTRSLGGSDEGLRYAAA
jgi:hypothetical protein